MSDRKARFAEAGRLAQMLIGIAKQAMADFAATVAEFGLPVNLARAVVLLSTPAPMRDLADRLAAVLLADVVDDLVATIHAEVDVEVGHRDAFGVQEPLEQ